MTIAPVNLASPDFKANPFPFYAHLRCEAPVYRTSLPDKRAVWLITRYDDVVEVLKDGRFSKDKAFARQKFWLPGILQPLARNMLDLDAPDHTRLRGLVHTVFTPRLIENLRERIQSLADELLDRLLSQSKMDLVCDYAAEIPTTIIAEVLGVPAKDRLKFRKWSNAGAAAIASRVGVLRAIPELAFFIRYIRSLMKMRRAKPEHDLISALVRAEE